MELKKLLLVSARYLRENLYREVRLKHLFEKEDVEVTFLLPTRKVSAIGYTEDVKNDPVFQQENTVFLNRWSQFIKYVKSCDAVLFGSWKSYSLLTEVAKAYGKPAINFNSTSGLDHWGHNVDLACFKSEFHKRHTLSLNQLHPNSKNNLKEDQIVITGSLIHDKPFGIEEKDKQNFYKRYQLKSNRPVAVLFPKAIGGMKAKVPKWFHDWSGEKCDKYNRTFLDKYIQICNAVREADYNLLIKMHPTAYTSYLTDYSDERRFWDKIADAVVLAPEDTYSCYKHMDVGIGINTHSALDTGYHRKPFIYVDSDKFEMPQTPIFRIVKHCRIPLGPSSHWDTKPLGNVNPWFPSWLGYFSRAENLAELLIQIHKSPPIFNEEKERFVDEFWFKDDGKASERIVQTVLEYVKKLDKSRKTTLISKMRYGVRLKLSDYKAKFNYCQFVDEREK